jgi:L-lactate dehydrogenase complex protein LldG
MTPARDRILASVRYGLVRAVLPDAPAKGRKRWMPAVEAASTDALIRQFSAALTTLSGHVHRAAEAEVADVVRGIAAQYGSSSFLSWNDEHLGCPGLLQALVSRGLARVPYDMPGDPEGRTGMALELAGIGLGLTGSHAALAESGAIVLVGGPGRGRLVSLLPPVHVALVAERRVRASFAALISEEPALLDTGSNVVLVAGPSRTADIEMTLSHGVHGPKHVHVILTS